ncbi:MAG TPA: hypothetical protein VK866_01875 [Acidimicrobiales bacterium]|nr:hypothetical protein [Acidimicrobiales bacterium]
MTHRRSTRVVVALVATGLALLVAACGGDDADWDAFCADVAVAEGAGPIFPDPAAPRPEPDPAALGALRALGDSAPPPLDADVAVLLAAVDAVTAALAAGPPAGDPETAPLPYDPAAVDTAREAVTTAARDRCGIDLDDPFG